MGLATSPAVVALSNNSITISSNSMSQDFHQSGIYTANFSNGFERSAVQTQSDQQIRRDKVRFEPPLVGIGEEEEPTALPVPVYDTAGMLSEMFNFPPPNEIGTGEWYRGNLLTDSKNNDHHRDTLSSSQHQISNINADSAAAMQLFLMNPQPRSPSPQPQPPPSSSTLHILLPSPSQNNPQFSSYLPIQPHQHQPFEIGGLVESQGLSLSLSSLQHLEAAKAEELRIGESGLLYFNQTGPGSSSSSNPHYYNKTGVTLQHNLQPPGQIRVGYGSSINGVNVLRNSKYVKAAQELLEEFCSVGRGQFKKNKFNRQNTNPSSSNNGNGNGGASSSNKDVPPPLSAADRIEHQRRKVKLLSMLDEVERRYNHYCEQMQMVVNSFDVVMGFGSAVPYTALAQKAMSRHFRCLKDSIAAQLKHSCELLGEKDAAGNSGITKGETPRLKLLEQSLRQQRTFHQMGMMEQEAWRPQRGLPERSVNILRAWLFEHFLHPYPSDADKHLLARQTGLSRSQVSNWFINARVRLWKPMVEEMYQQEAKDEDNEDINNAQTPTPSTTTAPVTATTTTTSPNKRSQINDQENDPSLFNEMVMVEDYGAGDNDQSGEIPGSTLIRFGAGNATTGDVSLTLGLRHAGNMPDNANAPSFSLRDFGG